MMSRFRGKKMSFTPMEYPDNERCVCVCVFLKPTNRIKGKQN